MPGIGMRSRKNAWNVMKSPEEDGVWKLKRTLRQYHSILTCALHQFSHGPLDSLALEQFQAQSF